MTKYLTHPWLAIRVQLALGALFVIAAVPKIADPPSFAHMIYNYRILPAGLINISSLVLPWVELLCGLALIVGIWRKAALAIIAILLAVFIAAISLNLARGNAIDCGCFNVSLADRTVEQRLGDMRLDILRDIGMLLMVAQVWWAITRSSGNILATSRKSMSASSETPKPDPGRQPTPAPPQPPEHPHPHPGPQPPAVPEPSPAPPPHPDPARGPSASH
ncbi:MAG TPA: MauE/DoxX family redox-associated membrane protein [Thermoanaerobaculia bacterium]|nr:MauE/DoxX family redox-associated membrane protein [Thermoanaerobaculia bacterium]